MSIKESLTELASISLTPTINSHFHYFPKKATACSTHIMITASSASTDQAKCGVPSCKCGAGCTCKSDECKC
ncbi:hypothetical protein E4T56_gene247 [Termitomyces sp. T112]|nr:hypothetical protein E4T56_gene247 [Termitomyces sp. T112]